MKGKHAEWRLMIDVNYIRSRLEIESNKQAPGKENMFVHDTRTIFEKRILNETGKI